MNPEYDLICPPGNHPHLTSPLQGEEYACADASASSPLRGEVPERSVGGGGADYKAKLKYAQARELRNNMTEAEKKLWYSLRKNNTGARFRRQQPIGPYIVDFISFDANLIIEVDGGQHAESKGDVVRDRFLKSEGYSVLRFWNNEIFENTEIVLETIAKQIALHHPHLTSSLQGEEYSEHVQ